MSLLQFDGWGQQGDSDGTEGISLQEEGISLQEEGQPSLIKKIINFALETLIFLIYLKYIEVKIGALSIHGIQGLII